MPIGNYHHYQNGSLISVPVTYMQQMAKWPDTCLKTGLLKSCSQFTRQTFSQVTLQQYFRVINTCEHHFNSTHLHFIYGTIMSKVYAKLCHTFFSPFCLNRTNQFSPWCFELDFLVLKLLGEIHTFNSFPVRGLHIAEARHNLSLHTKLNFQPVVAVLLDSDGL